MVRDLLIRGLVGGLFVSSFALLADVLTPKSFAGLFGAAPSVALWRVSRLVALATTGRGDCRRAVTVVGRRGRILLDGVLSMSRRDPSRPASKPQRRRL